MKKEQLENLQKQHNTEFLHVVVLMDMFRHGEISKMDTNHDVYERFLKRLQKQNQ